jgi:hypothetical protein
MHPLRVVTMRDIIPEKSELANRSVLCWEESGISQGVQRQRRKSCKRRVLVC